MSKFGEAKLRSTTSLTTSFGTHNSAVVEGKGGMNLKLVKNSDGTNGTRSRSQPSRQSDKGKETIREVSPFDMNGSTSFSSYRYDNNRPTTVERTASGRSKLKGSLVAASDALSFKFKRRKPSIRPPPRQIILPGVLEISARRQDEEVEERNRLREMAAQAIGLGPFMVSQGSGSRAESTEDEDEDQFSATQNNTIPSLGDPRSSESAPNITTRSPHDYNLSESISAQPSAGRLRSGSMLARSPTTSTAAPIPPFPSTVLALTLFRQTSGMYPKYYPPSSLRIFALSKSWKNRFLVLSTPAKLVMRGQIPAVSYLHLFKSSSPDEREMERLEINEDSVVFVSEEEVGGRRQVIKVGGADVGAMKKEYTHDEGGYTMWLLQITDQAEAQQWITNIKSAILGQRTVRAGLIPSHTLGNHEPRGDMDVMLSIRTQALATSPLSNSRSTDSTNPNNASQDRHSTPSISSQSVTSQRTDPKSTGTNGPVSALKGLFTSTRSRSGSRAASVDFEKSQEQNQDDLSANMRSLLSVLRPNTPDAPSVSVRKAGPVDPFDRRIDRRILTERQPVQWVTADQPPVNKDRTNRALSLGAFSLQPPPRKHSIRPISDLGNPDSTGVSKKTNRIALQVNDFSSGSRSTHTGRAETESFYATNQLSAFQFGIPEQNSRTPSVRSVSTVNSRDHRSSSSTNRSSAPKRWSRQGILPNQLTPPTEPPPAIPGNNITPGPHLYAAERTSSPTPSRSSEKSIVSTLPPFSKRTSSSSAKTVNSYDASRLHSIGTGASSTNGSISTRSSHRISMPPPLPPPTVALPPAPVQELQDTSASLETAPPSKSSFRNSVAQRAFRLPTTAPKPPPSTSLPPRPDESEMRTHQRSLSAGYSHSTTLEPIPGSPARSTSPFPPPVGPLPPTPPDDSLPSLQLPPVKRPSSIKRRLRMLSSPLPSAGQLQEIPISSSRNSIDVGSQIFMTPPTSPIGEKITLLQNDPTFLQMHISTLPSQSLNLSQVPPLPEEEAGITTSLSPPPRRGSRQLLETEQDGPRRLTVPDEALLTVREEPKHLSLSRPGSIISLNVSACCQESDGDNSLFGVTPTDDLPEEPLEEKLTVEPRHLSLSRPGSVISLGIMTLQ